MRSAPVPRVLIRISAGRSVTSAAIAARIVASAPENTAPLRATKASALRGERAKAPPDIVVYPSSTDDVVGVVDVCRAAGVPIVPFGAGTSLEGHVQALHGGIALYLR